MLVREVMTAPAVTVSTEATIKDAVELLAHYDIAAMPVLDASGALVGVVSEADVIREMIVPDPRLHAHSVRVTTTPYLARVADIMSNHPLTVTGETELAQAADLLTSTTVKSLPVVERGSVIGVLSRRDIITMLSRQDSRIEADIDDLLRTSGQDWLVDVRDGIVTVEGPSDEAEGHLAQTLVGAVAGVVGIRIQRVSA